MEQLNSKIYDKYKNLKRKRFIEADEWFRQRESKTEEYQTLTEDLIEDLKCENEKLRGEIASWQEKYFDTQKLLLEESQKSKQLLLEESQKTKELSEEVGRLQSQLLEKNNNWNNATPKSPFTSPRVRSRDTYKASPKKKTPSACTVQCEVQYKEATIIPYENLQAVQILPDCCRSNMTSPGDALGKSQKSCAFQMLMEFLIRMKLSLQCKAEGLCVSVVHQRSGYTFTLTWSRHEDGGDGELLYQVSSLGTLERVALDWMKEDIIFSMTMFPVFFERISRVVGHS